MTGPFFMRESGYVTKYLLTCECGEKLPVEVAQAGQQVRCECGRSVAVPALRAIRKLPQAEEEQVRRKSPGKWTFTHGAAFALGTLLVFGGFLFAGYGFLNGMRVKPMLQINPDLEKWVNSIDQATMGELWDEWIEVSKGLPAGLPDYAIGLNLYNGLRGMGQTGLIVCATGVILIIASELLGRRASARAGKAKR
jgi:hypothetical protein